MGLVLTVLKTSWPLVLAALGGGWVAWSLQGFRLDSVKTDFAGYKAQVAQQAVEARQAALKQKEQWIKEKEDAEQKAAEREAALRTERDAALGAGRRLRDDITALRVRLPNAIPSAVLATADTLAALLDQCQTDYRAMAEVADGHREDIRTLMSGTPADPVRPA